MSPHHLLSSLTWIKETDLAQLLLLPFFQMKMKNFMMRETHLKYSWLCSHHQKHMSGTLQHKGQCYPMMMMAVQETRWPHILANHYTITPPSSSYSSRRPIFSSLTLRFSTPEPSTETVHSRYRQRHGFSVDFDNGYDAVRFPSQPGQQEPPGRFYAESNSRPHWGQGFLLASLNP